MDNIPCDLVIHLGDNVSDVLELKKLYPNINFEYVPGNNDFFSSSLPNKKVIDFNGIKILITHGHLYNRNSLSYMAEENNCKYVLTGHTHMSEIIKDSDVIFMNPGSISRPRDSFFSYGVIEIENNKYSECIIKEEY